MVAIKSLHARMVYSSKASFGLRQSIIDRAHKDRAVSQAGLFGSDLGLKLTKISGLIWA